MYAMIVSERACVCKLRVCVVRWCEIAGGRRHLEFTRDTLLDEPGEEHLVDVHSCSVRVVEDQRKAKAVGAVVERLICMQRRAALRECECE
jgi:hypothetical protein